MVFHNIVCSAKGIRKRLDGAQITHSDLSSQANIQGQQPVCKKLICELSPLDLQQTARPNPGEGASQEPGTLLVGAEY